MNFSNTSNLRGHVKRKHPGILSLMCFITVNNVISCTSVLTFLDKLDILAPKIKFQQGTYICKECGANFTNCSNLRVHVKRKHPGILLSLIYFITVNNVISDLHNYVPLYLPF